MQAYINATYFDLANICIMGQLQFLPRPILFSTMKIQNCYLNLVEVPETVIVVLLVFIVHIATE